MSEDNQTEALDVATLPLADGRQVMLPLLTLAEVQQLKPVDDSLGDINWRGHKLAITSLEAFCDLPVPPAAAHSTVGIFRADKDDKAPFRAMAFCGLPTYRKVHPMDLRPLEQAVEGSFAAAAEINGEVFLVPDVCGLLYGEAARSLH